MNLMLLLITYTLYKRARRLNYHALNNGSDEEAPGEDHIFKKTVVNFTIYY
jgi:hypothetical protein